MWFIFVTFALVCLFNSGESYEPDRVTSLPGYTDQLSFRTFSGYLNGSDGTRLHYIFTESQRSPSSDPLLIWLNGGPGCSSLLGLFTEQGPFRTSNQGNSLIPNPFSWNKIANIFFLESPAGVGFSYKTDSTNYTIDDDQASLNNYLAINSFFTKFPQYKSNEFYLTGESYAGVYIPTLSVRLLNDSSINYKGFAIGNGYLDQHKLGNSKVYFAYYHGLFDSSVWSNLQSNCCSNVVDPSSTEPCEFVNNADDKCTKLVANLTDSIRSTGINPYNIYDQCSTSTLSESARYQQRNTVEHNRRTKSAWSLIEKTLLPWRAHQQTKVPEYEESYEASGLPCIDSGDLSNYLNRKDVKKALNIDEYGQNVNWSDCSIQVEDSYINIYKSLADQVKTSIEAGKRGLIYNGDVDMVCDFLGDQWFVEELGYTPITQYVPWYVNKQVSGFVKHFEKNLTMATVRGSGHMVPTDRPAAAFEMIKIFLEGRHFV